MVLRGAGGRGRAPPEGESAGAAGCGSSRSHLVGVDQPVVSRNGFPRKSEVVKISIFLCVPLGLGTPHLLNVRSPGDVRWFMFCEGDNPFVGKNVLSVFHSGNGPRLLISRKWGGMGLLLFHWFLRLEASKVKLMACGT